MANVARCCSMRASVDRAARTRRRSGVDCDMCFPSCGVGGVRYDHHWTCQWCLEDAMGKGQYDGNEYELHVTRRDSRKIPASDRPHPVVEHIDLKDSEEDRKVVGRHIVHMKVNDEHVAVNPQNHIPPLTWLDEDQLESWRVL